MAKAGDIIRVARKRLLMSQADVAQELGVSQRTVSYWERTDPPKQRVSELASVLELDSEQLLEALVTEAVRDPDLYQPRRSRHASPRRIKEMGGYAMGYDLQAEWADQVRRDASLARDLRELLGYLPSCIRDKERVHSADAMCSWDTLAEMAPDLTEDDIEALWPDLLECGYVEDIGSYYGVKWVLRLKFPDRD